MSGEEKLFELDIDFGKIEKVIAAFKKAPQIFEEELKKAMAEVVFGIEGDAKGFCPVGPNIPGVRTGGLLKSSIHGEVVSAFEGVVGTNTEYAPYVEFGTRPHEIRPKGKKALSYGVYQIRTKWLRSARTLKNSKTEQTGKVVVRSVKHPGTRPQPFLEPAFRNGEKEAEKIFNMAFERAIARMDGMAT